MATSEINQWREVGKQLVAAKIEFERACMAYCELIRSEAYARDDIQVMRRAVQAEQRMLAVYDLIQQAKGVTK